jgi:two-component system, OmpR family, sensor histidine kinase KdpD
LSLIAGSAEHLLVHLQANGEASALLEQGWRLASALDIAWTVLVTVAQTGEAGATDVCDAEFNRELQAALDVAGRATCKLLMTQPVAQSGPAATRAAALLTTLKEHAQNTMASIVLTHGTCANAKTNSRQSVVSFKSAFAEALPGVTLHLMSAKREDDGATEAMREQLARTWSDAPVVLGVLALCSLLGVALQAWFEPAILIMVYLTGVVYVALKKSRQAALVTVFAGVLLYDLLLMAPSNSTLRSQSHYVLVSIVMLVVGLLISHLAAQVRRQALNAEARNQRSQAMNRLAFALVQARTRQAIGKALAQALYLNLRASALLFPVDVSGHALEKQALKTELTGMAEDRSHGGCGDRSGSYADTHLFPSARATALDALALVSTPAGLTPLPGEHTTVSKLAAFDPSQCLLLRAANKPLAVLVISPLEREGFTPDDHALLASFVQQSTVALERSLFEQRSASTAMEAESERLRNTLLTAVSHDLRTPLTTIVGCATSLLEQSHAITEAQREALLRSVLAQARHLHALTSDILDLAQLQHGAVKLDMEWCPADELVEEARAAAATSLSTRQVHLHVPDNLAVWCDARLLSQALFNLLDNAGRHTPSSAQITVSALRQGDSFRWVVQDDGPGIQMGTEDEVFKKFYRVGHTKAQARASAAKPSQRNEAGARRQAELNLANPHAAATQNTHTHTHTHTQANTQANTGTGLGLAICAAVAQLHGGSIRVTSAPGARFELSLPQPSADAPHATSWHIDHTFP